VQLKQKAKNCRLEIE